LRGSYDSSGGQRETESDMTRPLAFHLLLLFTVSCLICSCRQTVRVDDTQNNGIYYWKTVFKFDQKDSVFLSEAGISKLYLRLFDVDVEGDEYSAKREVVPIGTLKFESKIPCGLEIVPTVFITLPAIKAYSGHEDDLAALIVKRMMAMCSYNDIEGVNEFQFDCDWDASTRSSYEQLCTAAKNILHDQGTMLSGTIRLHQIGEAIYPFDKGVLMLYNTGAIKDPKTGNSIISYTDVKKYLGVRTRVEKFNKARKKNCTQIDFAYPTFCWGVCYKEGGKFDGIIRALEFDNLPWLEKRGERYYVKESGVYEGKLFNEGQFVRAEYSSYDEIIKVKKLVDNTIRHDNSSNIIFHLDSNNLKKYKEHEILEILL